MKTKLTLLLLALALLASFPALAGDKLSDAAIKQKLLGYWASPRHYYLIKADGMKYRGDLGDYTPDCKWDVRGGIYYEETDAYQIVTLTDKKFVCRQLGKDHITYTYDRLTKEEAVGQ